MLLVFSRNEAPPLIANKPERALKRSSECCKKDFRGSKVMSELSKGSKNFLGDAVMTFF